MAGIATQNWQQVEVRSAHELRAWLEANAGQDESVWPVTHKKAPGAPYVSREAVLDEIAALAARGEKIAQM